MGVCVCESMHVCGLQLHAPAIDVPVYTTWQRERKIRINNTVNLFLKSSLHFRKFQTITCFRVMFDKIASVYFICKNVFMCI